ncbi:hypothetical protein BD769DRAFT_194050 [Suillus cothurnatus]|nr:hypothetical protein BD769DRAFT_194050 [Suillus cothurnatus]
MIHPFSGKLDESRPTPTAYLFSRQERVQESEINEGEMDASKNENIKAAYTRALSKTLFTRGRKSDAEFDADQIVPLVHARAGAEKRAVEAGRADGDGLTTLIKVVEDGIAMVRQGKNACCLTQSLIATISTLPPSSSSGDPAAG